MITNTIPSIKVEDGFLPNTQTGDISLSTLEITRNLATGKLRDFAQNLAFTTQMELAFGEGVKVGQLQETWGKGEIVFPTIEVRSSSELEGAWGAYAQTTNQIYLVEELLESQPIEQVVAVFLEEYGHFIDAQIHNVDAIGDEGQIFSALVRGESLSPINLYNLQKENDHNEIVLDGQIIEIENSNVVGSNPQLTSPNYIYKPFTGNLFSPAFGFSLIGGIVGAVSFRHIDQGQLGNCYLMVALAEIAEHNPDHILHHIIKDNGNNTFTFTIAGKTVTLDNQLPVNKANSQPVYAQYGGNSNRPGWVALIEKAYAYLNYGGQLKGPSESALVTIEQSGPDWWNPITWGKTPTTKIIYHRSYDSIKNGYSGRAMVDLFSGGQANFLSFNTGLKSKNFETKLQEFFNADRPTYFGTKLEKDLDINTAKNIGLRAGHAYSVRDYNENNNTYVLFNPWNEGNDYQRIQNGTTDDGYFGSVFEVSYNDLILAGSEIGWWEPKNTSLSLTGDTEETLVELKPPTNILIYELPSIVNKLDGLAVKQIWASDPNGWSDLSSVRFWLENNEGLEIDLITVHDFSPYSDNPNWAKIEDLLLSYLPIAEGNYIFNAQAEDQTGLLGPIFSQSIELQLKIPNGFDPYQYLASYQDLLMAFGNNPNLATQHYLNAGYWEGRSWDIFPEKLYLASYDDLMQVFGTDLHAATQHYLIAGFTEGRTVNGFNPTQYLASYDDLIFAFGNNPEAALDHFIYSGYWEGRLRDNFAEDIYLASHGDLIQAFSYDLEAATQHYILAGASEGRAKALFDPVAYLNKYPDLQAAFGNNLAAATQHYILAGFAEGRSWI